MLLGEGKGRLINRRSAEAKQKKTQMKSEIFLHFCCSLTPNMPILILLQPTAEIWESDDDAFGSNLNVPEFLIKGKVDVSGGGSPGALSGECSVLMHQPHARTIPECFLQK